MPGEVEESRCVLVGKCGGHLELFELLWVVLLHLHQVVGTVASASTHHKLFTQFSCTVSMALVRLRRPYWPIF